ncbi:hypothetical protein KVF89_22390 [Nocardioides carbamazepini]|uniref:DUF6093 family protein n=1 Tax=Nocardioides carbamazepini TaxID=2854259 RepID=UPI00214A6E4B|nr:DUF6093 family protein [Nocardioides carbamazepini]MCR1785306.1 hypothetical protein [Nocardioides carbamazepini]
MTLEDDIARALPGMRREAESLMTLTLAAYSPAGFTLDADGYKVPAFTPEGSTFGKVQGGARAGADTATRYIKIGDVERPVIEAGLHIPISAKVPVAGEQRGLLDGAWEYEITAVGRLDDPALLGRRYMVVAVPAKSFATARRLDVVQL